MVDAASSNPQQTGDLDRDNTLLQAAALAEHLNRSGVAFLPKPNADRVTELKQRFAPSIRVAALAEKKVAAKSAAEKPSPDKTPSPDKLSHAKPAPAPPAFTLGQVAKPYPGEPLPGVERTAQLEMLANTVAACTKCPELVSCRNHTVFGEGNPQSRFVFFGEGPGADEDRTGRPFVGKAGQLLTKMIGACKLTRDEVYILNTVKCRPPGNRNPEPDEVENCRSYFESQLEIIRPEYIVCLGAVGTQALLRSKLPIGKLRGKFHSYFDSKVVATYHPAYLLRNPAAKKAAWEDLQMMLKDAGISLR